MWWWGGCSKKTSDPASEQVGLSTSSDIASSAGLGDRFEDGEVGGHEDWLFLSGPDEDGRLEEDGRWKDMAWLGSRKAKSPLGSRLGITDSPANSFPGGDEDEPLLLLMSCPPEEEEDLLPAGTMATPPPAGIWTLSDWSMPGKVLPKLRLPCWKGGDAPDEFMEARQLER